MIVPILLVCACLAFLILEVFLVSFGALSVIAIACGVGGIMLAFGYDPVFGWSLTGVVVVGGPLALWGAFKALPKLPFARGFYLKAPKLTPEERSAAAPPQERLLGAVGTATSPLRPAGIATFDGEPRQVVTTGTLLPPGTRVRVVDVAGNRIVVERAP